MTLSLFLSHGLLPEYLYHINSKPNTPLPLYCTEATSLEYKHVVFRKPEFSATEKLGVDCVRNIVKNSVFPT
jgi:hypothetical protein